MRKKLISGVAAGAIALGLAAGVAAPAQAVGIELWQLTRYSGEYLGDFGRGTTYVGTIADNRASSLKVNDASYAILYQLRDYGGNKSRTFTIGAENLADFAFDNATSSIG